MKSISIVRHGENKIDLFDTAEEARDFAYEVTGGFTQINSDEVTDHTAAQEARSWEDYHDREKALELAISAGHRPGIGLTALADQIHQYLTRGTVAGKKSETTPIPL
jgi:hypothetical protein